METEKLAEEWAEHEGWRGEKKEGRRRSIFPQCLYIIYHSYWFIIWAPFH